MVGSTQARSSPSGWFGGAQHAHYRRLSMVRRVTGAVERRETEAKERLTVGCGVVWGTNGSCRTTGRC